QAMSSIRERLAPIGLPGGFPDMQRNSGALLEVASGELAHGRLVREANDGALGACVEHLVHEPRRGAGGGPQLGVGVLSLAHGGGVRAAGGMPGVTQLARPADRAL